MPWGTRTKGRSEALQYTLRVRVGVGLKSYGSHTRAALPRRPELIGGLSAAEGISTPPPKTGDGRNQRPML